MAQLKRLEQLDRVLVGFDRTRTIARVQERGTKVVKALGKGHLVHGGIGLGRHERLIQFNRPPMRVDRAVRLASDQSSSPSVEWVAPSRPRIFLSLGFADNTAS